MSRGEDERSPAVLSQVRKLDDLMKLFLNSHPPSKLAGGGKRGLECNWESSSNLLTVAFLRRQHIPK